ncbi:MAG: class I SAM-dependent methyltransferase [Thermofilaceae archaeon]|nr:class I SAM-dependent methyltransferase [Thermofilaceae archaeon]MCX8181002.1 class I SAM-dependent methyltransferase [Thermofilaceae archaeon]MDW8004107.1 methyltransferase domain-containing protein [Thermofilaceae archaeon]
MSLSSYILRRFLRNPREALRIKRAGDEIKEYIIWRLFNQLQSEDILRDLQTQAWWNFKDGVLAKLVCDILVDEGLAKRRGDFIEVTGSPSRPSITTKEAADMVSVIDNAIEALPGALVAGEKPSREEVKAMSAKLLDNFAVRLEFEAAVEAFGLDSLSSDATIVDVYPRVGASTLTLLEHTKARIIVVEPFSENLELVKRLVNLQGQQERVSYVLSTPEGAELGEKVDVVFMGEVIHWTLNPRLALSSCRKMLREDGFLAMAQTVYSSLGKIVSLAGYVLGAIQPPPTSDELREMLASAAFRVDKWLESLGVALVRASPS